MLKSLAPIRIAVLAFEFPAPVKPYFVIAIRLPYR